MVACKKVHSSMHVCQYVSVRGRECVGVLVCRCAEVKVFVRASRGEFQCAFV